MLAFIASARKAAPASQMLFSHRFISVSVVLTFIASAKEAAAASPLLFSHRVNCQCCVAFHCLSKGSSAISINAIIALYLGVSVLCYLSLLQKWKQRQRPLYYNGHPQFGELIFIASVREAERASPIFSADRRNCVSVVLTFIALIREAAPALPNLLAPKSSCVNVLLSFSASAREAAPAAPMLSNRSIVAVLALC